MIDCDKTPDGRIQASYHGVSVLRLRNTTDGRLRVLIDGDPRGDIGYEQESGESDSDFCFVIARRCTQVAKIRAPNRETRQDILDRDEAKLAALREATALREASALRVEKIVGTLSNPPLVNSWLMYIIILLLLFLLWQSVQN